LSFFLFSYSKNACAFKKLFKIPEHVGFSKFSS
jgi:hypothetical protein